MPKGECLLVGAEAWALQVGLGVLAFLSLVYKRYKVCVDSALQVLPRLALHARKALRGSVSVSCVRLRALPHCYMWQPLRELQERQACFTQSSVLVGVSLCTSEMCLGVIQRHLHARTQTRTHTHARV